VRSSQSNNVEGNAESVPENRSTIALPCVLEEALIHLQISKMGRCEVDQDCVADRQVSVTCPFGCILLRNRKYDNSPALQSLDAKMRAYIERCPSCVYGCLPIDEANIGCRENCCVVLNYQMD